MTKFAKLLSIVFHPLFISFYNFFFFILLIDTKGAALGFVITLFFLGCVLIPIFYTLAIVYKDNKDFEWSQVSEMSMDSRKKLLVYTIIYNVIFLLFLISLNEAFLGIYKSMFAFVIMGVVLSMILSFISHLLNFKNSLHALTASLFVCYSFIFSWKIPSIENMENNFSNIFIISGVVNLIVLLSIIWSRLYLKAHTYKEIVVGILVGILSPILLTLLTYGI